jgi:beta-galactosidase
MTLPEGVKAVWGLDKAYREATPTRERVCINGLWRWQPAPELTETAPTDGWGYFKVPGSWPGVTDYMQKDCQTLYADPKWADERLGGVSTAWYQREITIPEEWTGRRIALSTAYVNTAAAVYIDGEKVGEIRFPAGEVDLTPTCRPGTTHVLSMYFVGLPLRAVMLSFSDTSNPRQVRGRVARRGLCGDVYLIGEPAGPRITNVKVDTSVRNWQITLGAELAGLAPDGRYALRAEVTDNGRSVVQFTSDPFTAADLKDGSTTFTERWHPDKLWDTNTPQNQYDMSVSLVDAAGDVLDEALPERFGFREFWIDGRDFYLNGTRIFLSSVPLDNAQLGAAWATYDGARESMQRLQSFGINFVYTHNYSCQPGDHLTFAEILRAADDVGMLVALSQPHFRRYEWDAPDAEQTNGYAEVAEFYVDVAGNHPAVVMYSTSHNSTGYAEDMAPDMIDGISDPRTGGAVTNAEHALRAQAVINGLDPARVVYHHAGGNIGAMHTSNFYPNFVPIQEMCDWFEHWATTGVKPVFLCEYGAPFTWDWAMYRGWYEGKREFGSAAVPWEFCLAEWNAQLLGDKAFKISDLEAANVRWEAEQFRAGNLWHRWDYPNRIGSRDFNERYPIIDMYITDCWRAFRTWGMSANSPWEHGSYWQLRKGTDTGRKDYAVDWDRLQRPGLSPDYTEERYERMDTAYRLSDWIATPAAQALYRNNMALLAYIGGKADAVTSKDHNFVPGESVEKQLIIINNSRETVTCDYRWSWDVADALQGAGRIELLTGQQQRIPVRAELPESVAAGKYELQAAVTFSTGETQKDSFTIDVMPAPAKPEVAAKVAVFDPKGETAEALQDLGIDFELVEADADLAGCDVLAIGKGALALDTPAPDVTAVRNGLKVVIFEQTGDVLEKRFGFRVAEYGLRSVFRRVPDHPLLAGLTEEQLHDWRGKATVLPPTFPYEVDYSPTVEWCDIPVKRLWRCGNRGNVASALIEKPASGDFLPILDGGWSLQYTPLVQYREGTGMVLFCQADVTGRTEQDPAAETLARNIVQYVSEWRPAPRRRAVYCGDPLGRSYLETAGLSPAPYESGKLNDGDVLVVGPGGSERLAGDAPAIADWLRGGGHVLALGLDGDEASAFLPLQITTDMKEHIAAYFDPPAAGSPLAGIGPADVHDRAPRGLPLVTGGATPVGDGVLAAADGLNVVFCQLTPQDINPTLGVPTAFSVVKDDTGSPAALVSLGPVTRAGAKFGQRVEGTVAGRTYTLAVSARALGGEVSAYLGTERSARPRWGQRYSAGETVARGEEVRIPADQWNDLHITFPADEAAAEGLLAYLGCSQPGARLLIRSFALYEGDYAGGAAENLLENGDFAAGEEPWQFEFTQQRNVKRTYRRASCLVTRLLANMGAAGQTQLLEDISRPAGEGERRWLDGLYVDVPEGWDYPYLFFRW